MHRIHCFLLLTTVAVGLLLGPRAAAVQSSSTLCSCSGFATTQYFSLPNIRSATQSGNVTSGRCHRTPPPPTNCTQSPLNCVASVSFRVEAKPPFLPNFTWTIDGTQQPGGGPMTVFTRNYNESMLCGWFRIIEIFADGQRVLSTILTCSNCAG